MNKHSTAPMSALTALLFVLVTLVPVAGRAADVSQIELRRLLEPTPSELAQERNGRIYIYDGLRDTDIDVALREQFGRIEYMMFIRTKKTDETGALKRDEKTGEAEVEDDGC
jgi:hypothetical protein